MAALVKKSYKVNKKYNKNRTRKKGGVKKKNIKKSNNSKKTNTSKKSSQKTSKPKQPNCAPNPNKTLDFTCYSTNALYKLRDLWNVRHPDVKIEETKPKQIWLKLQDYMSDTCNNEKCWIEDSFIKSNIDKDILDNTFAPESPDEWKRNPQEWLSSLDIINVMKQYERRYKCFEFMGPSPIDFDTHIEFGDCVWEELCKFNIEEQLKKKKNKIGIIFNLDPHFKSGSHWVALFINIKKQVIYYFDSYGIKPDPQIKKFIDKVIKQANSLGIKLKYEYNKKRHQYSNTECGMYSLYFIVENLKDRKIEDLFNKTVADKEMIQLRKIYFNG